MQVYGNIATPLELKKGKTKDFYVLRLAENQGRDENRTTTWYEVTAFLSELDADLLAKGQFVKVTGRVEAQAFTKKDGTPGAALKIITSSILPVEARNNADAGQSA